jgi:hypothetical protein
MRRKGGLSTWSLDSLSILFMRTFHNAAERPAYRISGVTEDQEYRRI